MKRRSAKLGVACAIGLIALCVILQTVLGRSIETRIEAALAETEGVRGGIDRVGVCLPCLSYTLHGVQLEREVGSDWQPVLSAEAVRVGLRPSSLLRAAPGGAIHLEGAFLRFRADAASSSAGWGRIGNALLPVPLEQLTAERGRVALANPALDPPVRWMISDIRIRSEALQHRGASPTTVDMQGRLDGEGGIEARLRVREDETLELALGLQELPIRAFNDYLRNAIGIDVEAGRLTLDGHVTAAATGELEGKLQGRVEGLDVLGAADVSLKDSLGLAWEALAAAAFAVANRDGEDALHLETRIRQTLEDPGVDAWGLFGRLLRRTLVGLLESPVTALRWLVDRTTPERPGAGETG